MGRYAARKPQDVGSGPGPIGISRPLALVLATFAALLAACAADASGAQKPAGTLRCTIAGTPKADVIRGTPRADVICSKAGDDVVRARGGDDYVFAGRGADSVWGGPGTDRLLGARGADRLAGEAGRDFLYGEYGDDLLLGGPAADALYGHFGRDTLRGGPGRNHLSGGPGPDRGDPHEPFNPDCPFGTTEYCHFSMHVDVTTYCPSFTKSSGYCSGTTPYAPAGWKVYPEAGYFGKFSWYDAQQKNVDYGSIGRIVSGRLEGKVPNAGSPAFTIDGEAYSVVQPGVTFYTPNWPVSRAGGVGGPLYLNFVSGFRGADMYIDGYLFRR